jgi:hypothetical protein
MHSYTMLSRVWETAGRITVTKSHRQKCTLAFQYKSDFIAFIKSYFVFLFFYFAMDNIRQAVRGMPSQLSIPILRHILRLPAPVARIIMNELTEPLGKNQSYIKKVYNGGWVR